MSEQLDDKTKEALDVLNEFAKDKKAEFQGMLSEKYSHLKSAFGEASGKLYGQARETFAHGEEAAKGFASAVDKDVRKNPWPYIGGTAAAFLVLGLLLRGHKK